MNAAALAVAASRSAAVRWPSLLVAESRADHPQPCSRAPSSFLLGWRARRADLGAFGHGFPALGFLPSLLALTLYSMLPILRNGVAGITGVDPAIVEAARGMGMTDRQRLFQVELPLAAPVIMAGVRTAAGLDHRRGDAGGDLRRPDLARQLHLLRPADRELGAGPLRLRRCSAALAPTAIDQLLGLIEHGLAMRSRWRILCSATRWSSQPGRWRRSRSPLALTAAGAAGAPQ